jgi:tetratricopeptide (TPR) repeat protein
MNTRPQTQRGCAFCSITGISLLRRSGLTWLVSAQLILAGGIADFARAEDPPPQAVVSACRPQVPPAAWGTDHMPVLAEMNKGAAFIRAGNIQMTNRNYDGAIEQYDHAINVNPLNPNLYIARGMARLNREFDRAVEDFSQAIKLKPNSSMAFFERGAAYGLMAEYDRAIEDFGEAIELFPGNARAYAMRGSAHASKREYDAAIEDFDRAIKLDPLCLFYFTVRGRAYDSEGEHDRAVADYDRAIELEPNPNSASAFSLRGIAYRQKHDYDRAIQDFDQALKLDPNNASWLNERCFAEAIMGAFERALADCNESLRIRPDNAHTSIAAASLISGRVRSMTPLPITMPRSRSMRNWRPRFTDVAWRNV